MQYVNCRDVVGSTHNFVFLYAENGVAQDLHREVDNKKWHEQGKYFLDKKYVTRLLREGKKLRRDQGLFIRKLQNLNFNKISDNHLISLFETGYKLYSKFRAYFKTSRPEFQSIAETKLRSLLSQRLSNPEQIQRAFQLLITPQQLDDIQLEFIDWVNILFKRGEKNILILKHLYRHPWLVAQSYNKDLIFSSFSKKYSKDRKHRKSLKKDVERLKSKIHKIARDQRGIFKVFGNSKIVFYSWLFQETALERMRLKGGWSAADFLYFPIYREISLRTGIKLKDLYSFYRLSEVVTAVRLHMPIVSRTELNRRKAAFVFILKNRKLSFFSGHAAQKIIAREIKYLMTPLDSQGLHGQIACKGIARGRVRVVISGDLLMLNKAFRDFKKGEIMVTTMTQPNMVPLMKRAGAVVADEGGMVSHAAIISREFGIPCLVGTAVATRVLTDGDLVEVDANKGIVRKVK